MQFDGVRPRAVVCLSGGMDSCVCAAIAARDFDVYALHFSYGQRTEARELLAAASVSNILGARQFMHLEIDLFHRIGGSALTDLSIAVPNAPAEEEIGLDVPLTYVSVSQCAFFIGGGELGRGDWGGDDLHRCG